MTAGSWQQHISAMHAPHPSSASPADAGKAEHRKTQAAMRLHCACSAPLVGRVQVVAGHPKSKHGEVDAQVLLEQRCRWNGPACRFDCGFSELQSTC